VEIARDTQIRIRDIATSADLTDRTAQAIIADLEAAGYLTRTRAGRRTRYTVHLDRPFRQPAQDGHRIGPFLELLAASGDGDAAAS
jgi:DNA-binding MarR family transcriptional regulator